MLTAFKVNVVTPVTNGEIVSPVWPKKTPVLVVPSKSDSNSVSIMQTFVGLPDRHHLCLRVAI